MSSVIIIGAGMGGLATALRLRHLGFEVDIFEKQPRPGGRSNIIEEDGYRVDTGPTILVMKDTFNELYNSIGLDINDHLVLKQLDPNYRIYFHDQSSIDLYSNMAQLAAEVEKIEPGSTERLFQFIGANAAKYELGMPFVERNYDHITDLANPSAGWRLLKTKAYETLYGQVSKYFKTDKLRKAFSFHSMFLGLSPIDAPAMYSLITYADLVLGMWYPQGGIYSIIENMASIAEQRGIGMHLNAPVKQIIVENGHAKGIMLESGETVLSDMVISNADLPYTYQTLMNGSLPNTFYKRRLERWDYSCSGFLLYLGIDKIYPHLQHQGLYFSEDYRSNLDAIFKNKIMPEEPSFHLNVPTLTDAGLAPDGHSILYLLAPMPNLTAAIDWGQAASQVREKLLVRLEQIVDPDIRSHIVWERQYTPVDFKQDLNAMYGTAFGSLSHSFFQSSYFRPHNKSDDVAGLYFVGQGTYPGIGMPMVIISSRLVVERIKKEWQ
jgi:phytoene desaturase